MVKLVWRLYGNLIYYVFSTKNSRQITYLSNAVRSMRLECQYKYFPYGPKSRLIRALLYTNTNKIVYDEILLS